MKIFEHEDIHIEIDPMTEVLTQEEATAEFGPNWDGFGVYDEDECIDYDDEEGFDWDKEFLKWKSRRKENHS